MSSLLRAQPAAAFIRGGARPVTRAATPAMSARQRPLQLFPRALASHFSVASLAHQQRRLQNGVKISPRLHALAHAQAAPFATKLNPEQSSSALHGHASTLDDVSPVELYQRLTKDAERLPVLDDVQVTIVNTREKAREVLAKLRQLHTIHACDTEVADLDVKEQGPVGNGKVICASIYSGPNADFGDGPGSVIWIDNMGEAEGVLQEFKEWFEDRNVTKVWHNYGFDRHVMNNEGIDCKGFYGDTMHMARLWDTSRERVNGVGKGYSLEQLSADLLRPEYQKTSMKTLFGVAKPKKDGTPGKLKELPPLRELQSDPETRPRWIRYSAVDALATWWLRETLEQRLGETVWKNEQGVQGTMLDFYHMYLVAFGEILTELEAVGIKLDVPHLANVTEHAHLERDEMCEKFKTWAAQYCEDAKFMNPQSTQHVQTLLFGVYENGQRIAYDRAVKIEKDEKQIEEEMKAINEACPYVLLSLAELKDECRKRELKVTGTRVALMKRLMEDDYKNKVANMSEAELDRECAQKGLATTGTRDEKVLRLQQDFAFQQSLQDVTLEAPKKQREITIRSIGLTPQVFTPAGVPAVSGPVLRQLAGDPSADPPRWGALYEHFRLKRTPPSVGEEACKAVDALLQMTAIDTMISNFLLPLQQLADANGRVHCSLNLNTETGRLSARRPNLQNQPALEKDKYKIRDAFIAEPGNTLIVADYGQLELRILASITNCKSMIKAFELGGCFHSRTAAGMFEHLRKEIDEGKLLLEWDSSKGKPPVPLLKEKYGAERRKAKTLNFSIAYGKTVVGLANDWGVSQEEAQEILDAW